MKKQTLLAYLIEKDQESDDVSLDDTDNDLDLDATPDDENPKKAGLIRHAAGAHLIYKKQTEDGTYEELWIYSSGDRIGDELGVKKAILAGTDIQPNEMSSEDGEQHVEIVTLGNAQMLHITGLPN